MSSPTQNLTIMPESLSSSGNGILWRMSVETYHNLIEKGAFGPDEDVELMILEGRTFGQIPVADILS
jgi:hypothetical protein